MKGSLGSKRVGTTDLVREVEVLRSRAGRIKLDMFDKGNFPICALIRKIIVDVQYNFHYDVYAINDNFCCYSSQFFCLHSKSLDNYFI